MAINEVVVGPAEVVRRVSNIQDPWHTIGAVVGGAVVGDAGAGTGALGFIGSEAVTCGVFRRGVHFEPL